MLTGSRLAYDVIRGRLWVVCPACGEWNLTPLEERWEAIEECEQRFQTAEARASTANVGISRATGVELIRIGPALRDELANWRYGPRFHRRRRRAQVLTAGSAIVAGASAGGAILFGALASGAVVALWTGALVVSWGIPIHSVFETGSGVIARFETCHVRGAALELFELVDAAPRSVKPPGSSDAEARAPLARR